MVKLDLNLIGYINIFGKLTKVNAKDCFYSENELVFVVKQADLTRAIGKQGVNIKKVSNLLKKKIKVIAFNDDIVKFVGNLIYPIKAKEIRKEDNKVIITAENNTDKGRIFGRSKENLKEIQGIVNKYFKDIELIIE